MFRLILPPKCSILVVQVNPAIAEGHPLPPGSEDIAREQIDRMLELSGWAVQDAMAVNLYAKQGVAIREFELKSGHGSANYLLCNSMDLTPRLRDEFAKKIRRKHAALQDIRQVVEDKLAKMLAFNPLRMDYYKKYQEIIADYNREKDRATVEETFARLMALAATLDVEEKRAVQEGLSETELALFDLLFKENIGKADREKLKQASKSLLSALEQHLKTMPSWTKNTETQADVKVFILDSLWQSLPRPPFTEQETEMVAGRVYDYVWQRSATAGQAFAAA